MGNTPWIAIGRHLGSVRAYALDGATLTSETCGQSDKDALDPLESGAQVVVRIGEGVPDTVPCPVLPAGGTNLPAVTQDQPADVLGGWVRLWVAGFLAKHENWDGVICVADGDVTHWVHVSADEIISFASFLSLRLAASLGGGGAPDAQAVTDSQSRPERLAAHLRQAEVTGNTAAITGHLIGAELTAARVYWLGQQLALITPEAAGSAHALALSQLDVPFVSHTPETLISGGLSALARRLGFATAE